MTFYSPLRYPGGKNRLAKFISKICVDNNINGHYIEPYAGGASVALHLLIEKKINQITINDFDKSIYAFWYSVLNNTEKLCELIEKTPINVNEWRKQKKIQQNKMNSNLLELGFSTFFLNRTNMSGIITAGPIGGFSQKGNYKIDCRFNKIELIKKIKLIASFKKQITLYNLDALELIKLISSKSNNSNTLFYFDPPYFLKGPSLYMNSYKKEDHEKVANEIKGIKKMQWIVSYDNVEEVNQIYDWVKNKTKFTLIHNAHRARIGKEILFFSDKLNTNYLEI
ncbi:MAG TPA: DNA adenine methylase [Alphaproteobacteria bacterium]|nr:DNA adenine methylase [Alphaproteobacteria bacterium]